MEERPAHEAAAQRIRGALELGEVAGIRTPAVVVHGLFREPGI